MSFETLRAPFHQPGISSEDERERQFVGVKGVVQIGKRSHQQMELVQQPSNSDRRATLREWHHR
jgi:hypothetical protein